MTSSFSFFFFFFLKALHELLTGVLSHATKTTKKVTSTSIKASVNSKTAWKSGIEAIAASPALHIAARSTLRAWLATTGNMHVWLLHWHIFKLSNGSDKNKKFPYYLYPGELKSTAECVFEACISLQEASIDDAVEEEKEQVIIAALGAALQSIRKHAMTDELYSLILDGFELTKAALEQLLWTQEGGTDDQADDTEMIDSAVEMNNKPYFRSPVPRKAAEWLALVMWPFNTARQRLMCDAILQNNSSLSSTEAVQEVHQNISILQNNWCPVVLN
jgi:hypothetical protein